MLFRSSPLILSALFSGFIPYIDGIIISHRFNEEAFAVFRYGAMELPIVYLLATAFSNAMVREFSNLSLRDSLEMIKRRSLKLMHFLFPLTMLFLLVSKWMYPILFSHDFTRSADVFNVFLVLVISRLVFPQTILIGLKRTGVILFASIFEIIFNIVLCFVFIGKFGIVGVAYATFISSFAEKAFSVAYCHYKLKIKPAEYISIKNFLGYSVATAIVYFVTLFL